jgi:hypothetical protein
MAQVFWQIPNKSGPDYELGLFHGEQSGHLLLYCGNRILRIDFSVNQPKTYSFFLGETMFELNITTTGTDKQYELINTFSSQRLPQTHSHATDAAFPADKWVWLMLGFLALVAGFLIFFFIR